LGEHHPDVDLPCLWEKCGQGFKDEVNKKVFRGKEKRSADRIKGERNHKRKHYRCGGGSGREKEPPGLPFGKKVGFKDLYRKKRPRRAPRRGVPRRGKERATSPLASLTKRVKSRDSLFFDFLPPPERKKNKGGLEEKEGGGSTT